MGQRKPIELKPEDVKRLQDLEGDIEWLRREIARAKAVGIDLGTLEEDFEKMVKLRAGLLAEYAPKK